MNESKSRCSISGCDRIYRAHGFCRTHYSRWRKYGDPQSHVPIRDGVSRNVGYHGAHDRVKAARGRASEHGCAWAECSAAASDWAYDGQDPEEMIGMDHGTELRYSANPQHYLPLCKSHHIRFDAPRFCTRGHEMTEENSMPRSDGFRRCRTCDRARQRLAYARNASRIYPEAS